MYNWEHFQFHFLISVVFHLGHNSNPVE